MEELIEKKNQKEDSYATFKLIFAIIYVIVVMVTLIILVLSSVDIGSFAIIIMMILFILTIIYISISNSYKLSINKYYLLIVNLKIDLLQDEIFNLPNMLK